MNLKTSSKIKYIRGLFRGINDFKKGYQPINNIQGVQLKSGPLTKP